MKTVRLYYFPIFVYMNQANQVTIIKADGTRVPFDRGKLMAALRNSGADENRSREIVLKVEQRIYDPHAKYIRLLTAC